MARQKTIHEKWEIDSKEPMGGLRFHETEVKGKRIPVKGFSDKELVRIFGKEEAAKIKAENEKAVDEIEEV